MDDCGLKTQLFVEPINIGGKIFELADIPALVRTVTATLKRGFNKPKEAKQRHAKFVLECVSKGFARLPKVDVGFIKKLAESSDNKRRRCYE